MGCSINLSSEEDLLNQFFKVIPIKKIYANEVADFIMQNIDENNEDYERCLKCIVKKYFIGKEFVEEWKAMFNSLYLECKQEEKTADSYLCVKYIFVAVLFFCAPDSEKLFNAMTKIVSKIKIDNNGGLVEIKSIKKIVKLYLVLITSYPLSFLKSHVTNSEKLEELKSQGFKESVIDLYIESHLVSHVNSNYISLYKYCYKNFNELNQDDLLRSKIILLSKQHTESQIKRKITKVDETDLASMHSMKSDTTFQNYQELNKFSVYENLNN